MQSKQTPENNNAKEHITPRNLYRQRWQLPLCSTKVIAHKDQIQARGDLLGVIHRFNGGMVYEVKGKKFLLTENIFGGYPFLLNFSLNPKEDLNFRSPNFTGLPDAVLREARKICENIAHSIKLPENLHNIEVDVSGHLTPKLKLPTGWRLVKAVMKVQVRVPEIACDCDVDGPCGYCCDTCDCNSCYNCC